MTHATNQLAGSYDYRLVALSVVIAVLASYAALDLAGRIASARGAGRRLWLLGGATAMGIGIWSMHYIGMLAFRMPVPVLYDWPTVLVSLVSAIVASSIALYLVTRPSLTPALAILGSVFMGGAIAAMHYIGMEAMRLPAMCHYDASIVILSVALAVLIALVAITLVFFLRTEEHANSRRKIAAAVLMGAAIPAMHYTGMAAASFTATDSVEGSVAHALSISDLGTVSIIGVTFMVLGLALVTSLVDRRFSAQTRELETSERRSRRILEMSFDAFAEMDADGNITEWNKEAESVFGWPRAEAVGKSLEDLIVAGQSCESYRDEIAAVLECMSGEVGTRRFEIEAASRSNREMPTEITVSAIRREESLHFALFIRDLSERKRFERDLRAAKEAAEESNKAKSTFLATMSHEIRTPMNGILGMTELVLDSELTSEQREFMGLVQLSAESLLSIINDILDFSKIEAGKMELEIIPFDVRDNVGETMKALSFRADQKKLELIYEVDPGVPETVLGDCGRIRQVLINLVGNAIKFTEKGEISVSVTSKQSESPASPVAVHFAIRDTGIGIPREKQARIFEAFSQADGSMTRKYGGTGLGLTICKRIVELMDGQIWLESEEGSGSTFHFVVRLAPAEASAASPHPVAPERLRELSVLIVDDNFTNRRVLAEILARWGMRPTLVGGGVAGLEALQKAKAEGRPYPLVLLDGQMPDMDGFSLAECVRNDPSLIGATIMMLTSASQMGEATRCSELGIAAYLVKPIRQMELLSAICSVVEQALGPALGSPASAEAASLVAESTLRESRQRCRVLLAEDNEINQRLAVRLLENRGFEVTVAGDGKEALSEFERGRFEVVLMDVQMPNMDGLEATAAIRERDKLTNSHTRIIAMTAHALKGGEEQCIAAGMDAYVSKPIRSEEFYETIDRVLAQPK
jgi:two-component system, sensor histidine kinase and response regulator